MASTQARSDTAVPGGDWRAAGLRFFPYSRWLRARFGERVHRVSIDARLSCPNVDGRRARGGCVFCNNRSFSPSRRRPPASVSEQIDAGFQRVRRRYGCRRVLAYFQPGSNTYAPAAQLRTLYEAALRHPRVVGLAVSTRPDCVPDDVLDLLADLARRAYVCLELGMQTMHDRSLAWMNRAHDHQATVDAVGRARQRGLDVAAHLILGSPGETVDHVRATACEAARLGFHAVKFHQLYAVEDTPLARWVREGRVRLLDRAAYVALLADALERLPPAAVIQRLCGDAPPDLLVAPRWSLDKAAVRALLETELAARDSWQGKHYRSEGAPN